PLFLHDQTLLLEVAQSLSSMDSTMHQVGWALLASILLALALATVSGVSLVRRALSPVEEITRTARTIEKSSDLSRRLGYRGPPDEMGRLATTIDHMLEHLEKVFESQKHFVADASHELRTPLTVIQGNLDLLQRGMGEEDRRESLRASEAETRRMSQIVNDLLLLAEIESGQVKREESISLPELVRDEFRRAQQVAGNHHLVLGRLEDLTLKGDSYRLKQLLSNLVDNALRYTPEGGSITLSLFREGEWARLEVADTGIGIAPEHLPHIFERFYRVEQSRRQGGGTGLGLAIVKRIAEQHNGRVTVTSEPGTGSTFAVWLKL
ncbi:MAG: ATP-binding protein, partial [Chloroflexota bacterium]